MAEHENEALDLEEEDRLPWLESAEDYDDEDGDGKGRMIAMILLGIVLLAGVVGLIWYLVQSGDDGVNGEGELIAAEEGDYKTRPDDDDAKDFEGEGDAAFAASEGETVEAKLNTEAVEASAPVETAERQNAKAKPVETAPTGAMVQLGAFSKSDQANSAWTIYSRRFANLNDYPKKVTTGVVEGRTVYRLNAVTGSSNRATELCNALKAAGEACLVIP